MMTAGFKIAFAGCLIVLLALVCGCAPTGRLTGWGEVEEHDRIIDLKTGLSLSQPGLFDRLSRADIVFLGEIHNHPAQHRRQLEIVRELWTHYPDLVIGLEVFSRKYQRLLDDWIRGEVTSRDFEKKVVGRIMNRETFEVYYPLLDWARRKNITLLALNAPRNISALVARKGLAGLNRTQRNQIAGDIHLGPDAYRDRVARAFAHHQGLGDLDNFFAAQVVWDETMAETLTDFLKSPEGQGRRAVVIAGNEHVFRGQGLPDRVARRYSAVQTIVLMPVAGNQDMLVPSGGDFAWVSGPGPHARRPRLGVVLSRKSGQIVVESVAPQSEAVRIGLKPGDRLLELNGRDIESAMDLHRAALEKGSVAEHKLTVERNGRLLEFDFKFTSD